MGKINLKKMNWSAQVSTVPKRIIVQNMQICINFIITGKLTITLNITQYVFNIAIVRISRYSSYQLIMELIVLICSSHINIR